MPSNITQFANLARQGQPQREPFIPQDNQAAMQGWGGPLSVFAQAATSFLRGAAQSRQNEIAKQNEVRERNILALSTLMDQADASDATPLEKQQFKQEIARDLAGMMASEKYGREDGKHPLVNFAKTVASSMVGGPVYKVRPLDEAYLGEKFSRLMNPATRMSDVEQKAQALLAEARKQSYAPGTTLVDKSTLGSNPLVEEARQLYLQHGMEPSKAFASGLEDGLSFEQSRVVGADNAYAALVNAIGSRRQGATQVQTVDPATGEASVQPAVSKPFVYNPNLGFEQFTQPLSEVKGLTPSGIMQMRQTKQPHRMYMVNPQRKDSVLVDDYGNGLIVVGDRVVVEDPTMHGWEMQSSLYGMNFEKFTPEEIQAMKSDMLARLNHANSTITPKNKALLVGLPEMFDSYSTAGKPADGIRAVNARIDAAFKADEADRDQEDKKKTAELWRNTVNANKANFEGFTPDETRHIEQTRDTIAKLPVMRTYSKVMEIWNVGESAYNMWKRDKKAAVGVVDRAIPIVVARMTDPTTGVKPVEAQAWAEAVPAFGRLAILADKLQRGQALDDNTREQFMKLLKETKDATIRTAGEAVMPYKNSLKLMLGERYNRNVNGVTVESLILPGVFSGGGGGSSVKPSGPIGSGTVRTQTKTGSSNPW